MGYIEENAYKVMTDIFTSLTTDENQHFDGYFAADIYKVNGKLDVNPCYCGFSSTALTLVYVDAALKKGKVQTILISSIEQIKRKKMFFSKGFYVHIKCTDGTMYVVGVEPNLKYMPTQRENVEKFLRAFEL